MDTWVWTSRPTRGHHHPLHAKSVALWQIQLWIEKGAVAFRCIVIRMYNLCDSSMCVTCSFQYWHRVHSICPQRIPIWSEYNANTIPPLCPRAANAGRSISVPPTSPQTPPPSLNCCFSQKDSWGGWSHNADCGIGSASCYLWPRGPTWLQAEVV